MSVHIHSISDHLGEEPVFEEEINYPKFEIVEDPTTRMRVFFTTSFIGLHCWPDATGDVAYLANSHRHVFHVRVDLAVFHDDRDLEFIGVKDSLDSWLALQPFDLGTTSCEMLCVRIRERIENVYGVGRVTRVEVSEDGENGAVLEVL